MVSAKVAVMSVACWRRAAESVATAVSSANALTIYVGDFDFEGFGPYLDDEV